MDEVYKIPTFRYRSKYLAPALQYRLHCVENVAVVRQEARPSVSRGLRFRSTECVAVAGAGGPRQVHEDSGSGPAALNAWLWLGQEAPDRFTRAPVLAQQH